MTESEGNESNPLSLLATSSLPYVIKRICKRSLDLELDWNPI